MNLLFLIVCATLIAVLPLLQYSDSIAEFKADDPNQGKCEASEFVPQIANNLTLEIIKGESSFKLVNICPLVVFKISMKQGEKSPITLDLRFTNNLIYGFKNAVLSKAKGFGKDICQKAEVVIQFKEIGMIGDYQLSINGKSITGKSNITLTNCDIKFIFSGIPLEQNGETFIKVVVSKIDIIPERLIYNFSNLFSGQLTGYNTNLFECKNQFRLFLMSTFDKLFRNITKIYMNNVIYNVFEKYPCEIYVGKE